MKTCFQILIAVFGSVAIARADMVDDAKKTIERCEFAVRAARIPPTLPIKLVCDAPFKMLDDNDMVTVDCRAYCKERGIK